MEADPVSGWFSDDDHNPPVSSPAEPSEPFADSTSQPQDGSPPESEPRQKPPRTERPHHYGPRTCRICLETEEPKYPTDITSTLGISSASSRPSYVSDDPSVGRLLSPCKCRGSQKYVHEGCLTAWRLSNPTATRNYFQCPTCKFTYRMARLHWAAVLSSRVARMALTIVFLIISLFILGWIADPILDLWLDPINTISDTVTSVVADIDAREEPDYYDDEPATWTEHFLKGFLSLGLIGFLKTAWALTPWDWFNLRGTGFFGGGGRRRGGTGRDRFDNMNLVFVFVGAVTFLMVIWKAVGALSSRILKRVSDRVLDVEEDGDGEEFEEGNGPDDKKDQ